jgi:hypothetical protein
MYFHFNSHPIKNMKKSLFLAATITGLVVLLGGSVIVRAQPKAAARYEYAIVSWDAPDRIFYNLPNNQFQLVSFLKTGKNFPKDANPEEFCLTEACNFMAKSGWEPVNLDSQRIVFRRSPN